MATRVRLIPLSLKKTGGDITITESGTYDVSRYSRVIIPNGFTPGDLTPISLDIVRTITWSEFQNIDKSKVTNQVYSIRL